MVKITGNWPKLWVGLLKKIFIYIGEVIKDNPLIYQRKAVILLLPKKTKNKAIEI